MLDEDQSTAPWGRVNLICANPECQNKFSRTKSDYEQKKLLGRNLYCCHPCAIKMIKAKSDKWEVKKKRTIYER